MMVIDESTYRIKEVLQSLHKLNHRLAPGVADESLLRKTKTVLGGDTALALLHPLVHPWLERSLDFFVVSAGGYVEVQVRVAHVAVANDVENGLALVLGIDEVQLVHAGAAVVDKLVEVGEGDGEIVFVHAAEVLAGFGDAFTAGPEVLRLCFVLGDDAVGDNFFGHDVLEEGGELFAVVVGVGAGGLDQAVEGVFVGEGEGLAGCADIEVLALVVHKLEGREDF